MDSSQITAEAPHTARRSPGKTFHRENRRKCDCAQPLSPREFWGRGNSLGDALGAKVSGDEVGGDGGRVRSWQGALLYPVLEEACLIPANEFGKQLLVVGRMTLCSLPRPQRGSASLL